MLNNELASTRCYQKHMNETFVYASDTNRAFSFSGIGFCITITIKEPRPVLETDNLSVTQSGEG